MTVHDTTGRADAATAQTRHAVETAARRQGFREVDPPTLAPAARYADRYPDDGLLRVADGPGAEPPDDTVLVPEATLPLAAAVADGERPDGSPARLLRAGPCWRAAEERADRRREFRRTALGLFGDAGPTADAEALEAAVTALAAAGIEPGDVPVRVSHRGLLEAVFESFSGEIDVSAALAATAAHDPAAEAYREALVDAGLNYGQADTGAELLGLGLDDLDALADLTGSDAVAAAVDDLRAALEAAGADVVDWLDVSLTALPAPDYYTGVTVSVPRPGEEWVARGGRFDDLVADLGGDACPAVGVEFDHPRLARLSERDGTSGSERGEAHART